MVNSNAGTLETVAETVAWIPGPEDPDVGVEILIDAFQMCLHSCTLHQTSKFENLGLNPSRMRIVM